MPYASIAASLLLFIVAALIKYKKATWLISGYNTASREEKEKYDVEKLCRYMGNFIFTLAFIWSAMTVLLIFYGEQSTLIMTIGGGVLVAAIVAGIIFLNTRNRVKK